LEGFENGFIATSGVAALPFLMRFMADSFPKQVNRRAWPGLSGESGPFFSLT
jgi:hypothetical protein